MSKFRETGVSPESQEGMKIDSIRVVTPGEILSKESQQFLTKEEAFQYLASEDSVFRKILILGYSDTGIKSSTVTGDDRVAWIIGDIENPAINSPVPSYVKEVDRFRVFGADDPGVRDIVLTGFKDSIWDGEPVRVVLSKPGTAVLVLGVKGGIRARGEKITEEMVGEIAGLFDNVARKAERAIKRLSKGELELDFRQERS